MHTLYIYAIGEEKPYRTVKYDFGYLTKDGIKLFVNGKYITLALNADDVIHFKSIECI